MTRTLLAGCAYVVTLDESASVLRDADVLIADGRIAAIAPAGTLDPAATVGRVGGLGSVGAQRVDGRRRLLMPGLVNLHTHASMTLLRGLAEDVDLGGFLTRVFAAEGAVMDPATVELGARLGALESLRGGTTTMLDMYLHAEAAHAGAVAAGIRHATGPVFFDSPGPDGLTWDARLDALAAWPGVNDRAGGPKTPDVLCPHSTYLVSPTHLAELRHAVRGWSHPVLHTHASETAAENAQVATAYGRTPLQVLADAGFLDGGMPVVIGHGVHLGDADRALAAATGVTVAHCPGSNLKLASGALSWNEYRDTGVRLGIGTDGCSSSNDLDMWSAMRLAALLARLTAGRPDATTSHEILRAATVGGARAVGMADEFGTVEVGKQADLILLDLDQPHLTPVHDVHALLVFAAGRGDVTDVFVAGRRVVADRRSTLLDEADLLARCRERGAEARRGAATAGPR